MPVKRSLQSFFGSTYDSSKAYGTVFPCDLRRKGEMFKVSQYTPRTMVGTLFLEVQYNVHAIQNKYLLLGTRTLY